MRSTIKFLVASVFVSSMFVFGVVTNANASATVDDSVNGKDVGTSDWSASPQAQPSDKRSNYELLQGKWQNTDDKTNFLIFEKNHRKELAEGMEELDDEEEDSVEFSPVSNPVGRPVMREIPKPDAIAPEINFPEEKEEEEKKETEPSYQKDRSLNDAIGENKATEPNLSNSPITSLRAAIGLNDRFLFIKEIFNNNSEKYNTIIDQLDKMETIQQAVDYLKVNLSLQKNETSMKFVDLLKRRFTK